VAAAYGETNDTDRAGRSRGQHPLPGRHATGEIETFEAVFDSASARRLGVSSVMGMAITIKGPAHDVSRARIHPERELTAASSSVLWAR
jgi:hypothetical protein